MLESLKLKCENLMTFIPSNLYIHSRTSDETITFSKLTIPVFLSAYMNEAVTNLIKNMENQINNDTINENQVHLYIDPFKMCYLTWPMRRDNGDFFTVTLGPLITEHLTSEEIRYMGYKMKLGSDNCFILESFYGLVPHFDSIQLARISSMFLDYLTVEPHLPQIIREDASLSFPDDSTLMINKFDTFDFVEHNFTLEAEMLKAIENGDLEYTEKAAKNINSSVNLPTRFPSNPLREHKNLGITINSISLRAAIKGGLNNSIAHSLSHNFAILIEQQTTVDGLNDLFGQMLITYTESVHKYAMKGYSETIVNAVTYIRTHLTERITLREIAEYLHLSNEHLSRQFKKEMNITITDYIHKLKIEESCSFLENGKYSISDIAFTFGYSSPPHYSKMFKHIMGVSPKIWVKDKRELS